MPWTSCQVPVRDDRSTSDIPSFRELPARAGRAPFGRFRRYRHLTPLVSPVADLVAEGDPRKWIHGRAACGARPIAQKTCFTRMLYILRSTSFILISAIAWDGLRPRGQALAQFMIVWQR